MSTVKLSAVQRAVRMLEAAGARFGVEFQDFHAGLPLQAAREHKYERMFDNVATFDYIRILEKMAPGDVHVFSHDDIDHLRSLRGAIGGYSNRTRGPGSFMVALSKDAKRLEVLCVLPAPASQPETAES